MSAPDAVRQAATDAIRSLKNVPMTEDGIATIVCAALKAAILAERERCAKIADEQEAYHLRYRTSSEAQRAGTANMIAIKIREPLK